MFWGLGQALGFHASGFYGVRVWGFKGFGEGCMANRAYERGAESLGFSVVGFGGITAVEASAAKSCTILVKRMGAGA